MKKLFLIIASIGILSSCLKDKTGNIEPIVEPPLFQLVKKDTLTTGEYQGLIIGSRANDLYAQAQENKVEYLNIVSNFVVDFKDLKSRLSFYDYVLFDEVQGSSQGVQLALKNKKLQNIYLNNGNPLNQWPLRGDKHINVGMTSDEVAEVLLFLKASNMSTLDRMLLLTKNLSTGFDEAMSSSPKWYFAKTIDENNMQEVVLNISEGRLISITINNFQKM